MLALWTDKLETDECAFINASIAARQADLDAARRRRRNFRIGTAGAFLLLAIFGGYNYVAAEAERERRRPIYRESDWVRVEPGEFCMGSRSQGEPAGECTGPLELAEDPDAQDDEKPAHRVRIEKPFLLGKYEVTFEEYDRFVYDSLDKGMRLPSDSGFCGQTKAKGKLTPEECKRLPVINVSWDDAQAYADWLSRKLSKHFRLPTEAEWEYAARAGTHTPRFWKENPENPCRHANVLDAKNFDEIKRRGYNVKEGFECPDDFLFIAPVGGFQANPWKLNDMLGNVFEWVEDCAALYKDTPRNGTAVAGTGCALRVIRGGSWDARPSGLRSAARLWGTPVGRNFDLGFRLAQDL